MGFPPTRFGQIEALRGLSVIAPDCNSCHEIIRSMNRAILLVMLFISCLRIGQEESPQNAAAQSVTLRTLAFEVAGMGFPVRRTDIFVKASGTSKPKRLVEGINPTLSPDGQKIAYCVRLGPTAFGQIELINVDGSGHMQLTELKGGACPLDWSPDGEKMALIAYGASPPSIFVMDKNGGNVRQVIAGYGARWSPNGKQLVFCRNPESHGMSGSIWTANADGTGATKVIDDNSNVLEVGWFPDGKRIAFSSERENKRKSAIFRINLDGSGLETIAVDKHRSLYFPVLSPDGTQLVADSIDSGDSDVVLLDVASHQAKVLAHGIHPSVLWEER
jgi:Tol biopolymer transport system component